MSITLADAKAMMNDESLAKLKSFVSNQTTINLENKVNNDILMQALCRAVTDGLIKPSSFNDKIIKLLNSATNTLSQSKLIDILTQVHANQPDVICKVSLMSPDMSVTHKEWILDEHNTNFNKIFGYVVKHFNMTPSSVRNKMKESLKPTIVNNIAQLLSKYEKDPSLDNIIVSINTISRLVNMEGFLLFANFSSNNNL